MSDDVKNTFFLSFKLSCNSTWTLFSWIIPLTDRRTDALWGNGPAGDNRKAFIAALRSLVCIVPTGVVSLLGSPPAESSSCVQENVAQRAIIAGFHDFIGSNGLSGRGNLTTSRHLVFPHTSMNSQKKSNSQVHPRGIQPTRPPFDKFNHSSCVCKDSLFEADKVSVERTRPAVHWKRGWENSLGFVKKKTQLWYD